MTILLVAGMLIGGYVAFRTDSGLPHGTATATPVAVVTAPAATGATAARRPTPEPVEHATELAQPAPVAAALAPGALATAATVEPTPVAAAASPPALVDVRIDSTPSGATVTLVDRGKTQYVGSTPVSAAVDPSREYDLVLSYPNKPTALQHLDPSSTRRIAVTLGAPGSVARPVDSAQRRVDRATVESLPGTRKPGRQAAEPETGEGTLKISSKPPCEIIIDGRSTGLVTPQIAIALAAGAHRVTLVNHEKDIKKTFSVQISASATEKIIEDFMK
jgi:hypothetical protein